jgi:hypothetical protein
MGRRVLLFVAFVVCASPVFGQTREPVGPFVFDLRGVRGGLPAATGWTPPVPEDTPVPASGLGVEGGGHVYFGTTGPVRWGAGAALAIVRSRTTPLNDTSPAVTSRATTLAPQVSANFGHKLGWSYLSAGYGWASVSSESAAIEGVPARVAESGWGGASSIGGGARWFITDHLGVGFDVRWHRLSGRDATATSAAAARTTLFNLAIGISLQ